ncbi:CMV 1a interacting protein 1 [Zea mays]|uniref:CMV 1a interacting protein 1 n=1 Tax=Zea mays TaxID=4577 RepID=A0A1D6I0E2_MAIZE|nr:CMV 1a interacting protein 1 [Zea mays]
MPRRQALKGQARVAALRELRALATAHQSVTKAIAEAGFTRGALERPAWSGETTLSRLVGALIAFTPLYLVLKLASREVIIR